jgi:hypothetical protein
MALSRVLFGPLALALRWGGLPWRAQDDVVMGGVSQSQARVTPAGSLVFEGVLRHENNGGFASVRTDLAAAAAGDAELAAVLRGGRGITIHAQGDGNSYLFRASKLGVNDGVYYSCRVDTERGKRTFTTCLLEDLVPRWRGREVHAPRITAGEQLATVGFMITKEGGQGGDFALEVLSMAVVV